MSRSSKRRHRLMYNFWLDINKPEEEEIADTIENLKDTRSFAKAVRDGIRLIWELKQGKTEYLFQLFPWLRAEITPTPLVFAADYQPQVSSQLKRIEQMLLEQSQTPPLGTDLNGGGIKRLNVGSTAPPSFDDDDMPDLKKRFAEAGGKVAIKFKHKKAISWQYSDLTIWPEGIGAAACFALDETGQPADTDSLSGETVILDLGMYTLDALQMSDGNFNPESLQHATWENDGIRANILEPILQLLKKQSADFQIVTTANGLAQGGIDTIDGNYVIQSEQAEVDIEPLFVKYSERYAERIANNIVDGVFKRAARSSLAHPGRWRSGAGLRLAKMRLKPYV